MLRINGKRISEYSYFRFPTRSFNSSRDVEKGVVAKKGLLQPGNLNENFPQRWNFKTSLFSADQDEFLYFFKGTCKFIREG